MDTKNLERFEQEFRPDQFLIEQEKWGNTFFLIKEGLVDVIKTVNGQDRKITTLGPGDFLGEMSLIDEDSSRSASACARSEVKAIKLNERQLNRQLKENDSFRNRLLKEMTHRLMNTTEQLTHARTEGDFLYNLGFLFLHYLQEEGMSFEEADITLDFKPDPESLAYQLDTSEEIMRQYLSNPHSSYLDNVPEETREKLHKISRRVGEKFSDSVTVKTHVNAEQTTKQSDEDRSLLEWTRRAEELRKLIDDKGDKLSRNKFKSVHYEYRQMEEIAKGGKGQFGSNNPEYLFERFKSFVEGLGRALKRYDWEDFD
ncbi:MAG: cyclic nucleotide-binding domain-containing protein [bacterium]